MMLLRMLPVFCAGALALAEIKVTIREYELPTADERPHDPAVGADGSLWYTGQSANLLGRLDESSGQVEEFPLTIPGSGPHGLVADGAGQIWFTANSRGYIGRLNPVTREVESFFLPDERATDPHTPIFDREGVLWFTVQSGNLVGRLDPLTGAITLKQPPTAGARPYGIVIHPDGEPYFCEFGTNKLARIDRQTLEFREWTLPEGARPRRLAATPDGRLYYTDYARGYLGRLDPLTGAVQEWMSPGGARSAPYGITATADGVVWYSESGVQPNTLVRFDPATEAMQKWTIPSGGGVVRHMVAAPDGRLYLACSGVNRVAVVTISE